MDVACSCGKSYHVDADFAYNAQCPGCNKVFMCNGHIELILLGDAEAKNSGTIIQGREEES